MKPAFASIFGQEPAIDALSRAYTSGRLPHGLIFAGPAGVGKGTTALALAALYLCPAAKGTSRCGACESCRLADAGNHPDYHRVYRQLIRLEKSEAKARDLPKQIIGTYLVAPAHLKAAMNHGRVFVVEESELMNAFAQNAVLKTLEEPFDRTLIILLTDQPAALLPTIRSRCQLIRFGHLPETMVVAELIRQGISPADAHDAAAFSEGSLGLARQWLDDGVISAGRELHQHLNALAAGQRVEALPDFLRRSAEAYAARQLERDELSSKDQATREGMTLYLRLASLMLRRQMRQTRDADTLERLCQAIEAIVRSEQYVDANVSVQLAAQQLSITLQRNLAP